MTQIAITVKSNYNETQIVKRLYSPSYQPVPPKNEGKRASMQLSASAKKAVGQAAENIQYHTVKTSKGKYNGLFLTLTYAENMHTEKQQIESKAQLNSWLTFVRQIHKKVKYIWVAETQKRGAIHYHIVFNHRLSVKCLKAWKYGYKKGVAIKHSTAAYMAKYISKGSNEGYNFPIYGNRYGMSQTVSKEIKYNVTEVYTIAYEKAISDTLDAWSSYSNDYVSVKYHKNYIVKGGQIYDFTHKLHPLLLELQAIINN